jgi:hypothetical protein
MNYETRKDVSAQRRKFIISKLSQVEGFRTREALAIGIPPTVVRRIIVELSKAGKCHVSTINRQHVVYFDCQARAVQWRDRNLPKTQYAPVQVSGKVRDTRSADYSRAKVTIAPRPLGRYELPPGERVLGGFTTLGVGRYLEVES